MVSRIINILWHLPQKEAIDSWPATGYYQMHLSHVTALGVDASPLSYK